MKKEMRIISFVFFLILINIISASVESTEAANRLEFGHVIVLENVSLDKEYLSPGEEGTLSVKLKNNANERIYDVRINITLPSGLYFLNGLSQIKLLHIEANETVLLESKIIASPTVSEGVYSCEITTLYNNHNAVIRQDEDSFTLFVRSPPKIFAQISSSEINKDNNIGEIKINFVNNDLGNVRFLTVELKQSKEFEIISNDIEYIGDLDSDDIESVEFRIKARRGDKINLPVKITYKDSLNKNYSEDISLELILRSKKDLGLSSGLSAFSLFIILLIIGGLSYWGYKKYKNKKYISPHKSL
jgi:hypothetical protein